MDAVRLGVLYMAALVSLLGTAEQHCTMGDAKALKFHTFISFPLYLLAIGMLVRPRLNPVSLIGALPLVPIFLWQAWWGVQLFLVSNLRGLTACALILRDHNFPIDHTWFELAIAPFYFSASVGSIFVIAYACWRSRKYQNGSDQADVFD